MGSKESRPGNGLANVTGIAPNDAAQLAAAKIATAGDLWSEVGRDLDRGVENVAARVGMDPIRLIEVLVAAYELDKDQAEGGPWRYWPEALVATVVFGAAALALDALGAWAWIGDRV